MIRLFEEHQVRKTTELSSSLWDFSQVTDGKKYAGWKSNGAVLLGKAILALKLTEDRALYERSF